MWNRFYRHVKAIKMNKNYSESDVDDSILRNKILPSYCAVVYDPERASA